MPVAAAAAPPDVPLGNINGVIRVAASLCWVNAVGFGAFAGWQVLTR